MDIEIIELSIVATNMKSVLSPIAMWYYQQQYHKSSLITIIYNITAGVIVIVCYQYGYIKHIIATTNIAYSQWLLEVANGNETI